MCIDLEEDNGVKIIMRKLGKANAFIILIITPCECFIFGFVADGLSLEAKWQQVASCLSDSSQYSGLFQ